MGATLAISIANYAGVFITWDKFFGTFVPELDREKPD